MFGIEEHRIVAEAACAAWCIEDQARPDAFGDQRLRILRVAQQHDHRVEVRGPPLRIEAFERAEQLGDVGCAVAVAAGIARRIQSQRAAERVHAQARVVGQRRQAGDPCGVARLQQRVLDKGQSGFLDVGHAQIRLRDQFGAGAVKQRAQLGELAGIAAGQG